MSRIFLEIFLIIYAGFIYMEWCSVLRWAFVRKINLTQRTLPTKLGLAMNIKFSSYGNRQNYRITLSISRVLPILTARATTSPLRTLGTAASVSGLTIEI